MHPGALRCAASRWRTVGFASEAAGKGGTLGGGGGGLMHKSLFAIQWPRLIGFVKVGLPPAVLTNTDAWEPTPVRLLAKGTNVAGSSPAGKDKPYQSASVLLTKDCVPVRSVSAERSLLTMSARNASVSPTIASRSALLCPSC